MVAVVEALGDGGDERLHQLKVRNACDYSESASPYKFIGVCKIFA